jgi:hypothetical protein
MADPHLGRRADGGGWLPGRLEPDAPFEPRPAPPARFHEALSISLGSLLGASGPYFLHRRGKEPGGTSALHTAAIPLLDRPGGELRLPQDRRIKSRVPQGPRVKSAWVNERFSSVLIFQRPDAGPGGHRLRGRAKAAGLASRESVSLRAPPTAMTRAPSATRVGTRTLSGRFGPGRSDPTPA